MELKKENIPEYSKMGLSGFTFFYNLYYYFFNNSEYERCKTRHDRSNDPFERGALFGTGMYRRLLSFSNLFCMGSSVLMFIDNLFKIDNKKRN